MNNTVYCKKCGKEIPDDSIFCPECGFELSSSIADNPNNLSGESDNEQEREPIKLSDCSQEYGNIPSKRFCIKRKNVMIAISATVAMSALIASYLFFFSSKKVTSHDTSLVDLPNDNSQNGNPDIDEKYLGSWSWINNDPNGSGAAMKIREGETKNEYLVGYLQASEDTMYRVEIIATDDKNNDCLVYKRSDCQTLYFNNPADNEYYSQENVDGKIYRNGEYLVWYERDSDGRELEMTFDRGQSSVSETDDKNMDSEINDFETPDENTKDVEDGIIGGYSDTVDGEYSMQKNINKENSDQSKKELLNEYSAPNFMLYELATTYYRIHNNQTPPYVEIDSEDGNNVTIHLYEFAEDHIATWDWYFIDRTTLKGTDILGNAVDLSSCDFGEEDYMLYNSDSSMIKESELRDFSAWECKVARNEIFARHGRKFTDPDLQEYFNSKDWYTPLYDSAQFDDSVLSETEKNNLDIIKKFEMKKGYK